ncbi:cyclic nucleotide-binding domain-containing protein [Enterovirga sp.]|uniref:cyclic nucleotide-binding domain-containing protein n=1 Tax=Enterovirga sp. TaxID=2026350 RepID=UPI00262C69E7|nr:cyclic nucleotide-binding domain-containing protein [Enterovirga sp.]MDB5590219.1 cyclic nucleotide-binding protein [Enterovirga sp.]
MALDDTIAILSQAPLLGHLERDALRLVAFSAETRRLRTNEILFREGERSDGGYVVLSGEIAASRAASGEVTLAGPGSLVGRTALFVRIVRPASAIAREPTTLLRISPTLMRRLLEEFPSAAGEVREALAQDLTELSDGLERVRRMLLAIDEKRPPIKAPGSP